jgi:CRP-like cAMP-binding protein
VFEIDLARVDPDRLPYTPLLSDLTRDELNSFIGKLVVTSAAAGTLICREGDPAESMFVIVHGLVRVTSRDANGNPLWLTNLADGSFFGEFGLLGDGRRHADVEVVQDSELLQIERSRLDELIATHPRVEKVLFDFYKARVIDTLLAKNPVFRSLSADERRNLLDMAALEIHEAGSMVIQEGDDGQHLFVIKSGRVQVSTSMADKPIALATLKPGDIFGHGGRGCTRTDRAG